MLTAAQTPEIHLGLAFGSMQFSSSSGPLMRGTQTYAPRDSIPTDQFALQGAWTIGDQDVESADPGASIVLRYRASEVNLVAGAGTGPNPVMLGVELDGVPQTSVAVAGDDLYRIVSNGPNGVHSLVLHPQASGFQAFAFTFGSG